MRAVTEEQLKASFINATDDELARLPMPGLHESIWEDREFLGWRDAQSPLRGYIAHWRGDLLVSVVVRSAPGGLRPGIAAMCSLCRSMQPATQVRMFSARFAGKRGREGSTVGTYLCESLECPFIIRKAPPSLTTPSQLAKRGGEMLERLDRLTARIAAG